MYGAQGTVTTASEQRQQWGSVHLQGKPFNRLDPFHFATASAHNEWPRWPFGWMKMWINFDLAQICHIEIYSASAQTTVHIPHQHLCDPLRSRSLPLTKCTRSINHSKWYYWHMYSASNSNSLFRLLTLVAHSPNFRAKTLITEMIVLLASIWLHGFRSISTSQSGECYKYQ